MRNLHKRLIVSLSGIHLLLPIFVASYADSPDSVIQTILNHEVAQFMQIVLDSESSSVGFSPEMSVLLTAFEFCTLLVPVLIKSL